MYIQFYHTKNDPRELNKTLSAITDFGEITMSPKGAQIDLINPEFILHYNSKIGSANYFYLRDSGRYYWMDEPIVEEGQRMIIRGHLDVLQTFKSDIMKCKITVNRNENAKSPYLNDTNFPVEEKALRDLAKFPSQPFAGYKSYLEFILLTSGGDI